MIDREVLLCNTSNAYVEETHHFHRSDGLSTYRDGETPAELPALKGEGRSLGHGRLLLTCVV